MIPASKNATIESLFAGMNRRMLKRHFQALHLFGADNFSRVDRSRPVIVYGNHSCWWDGLIEFFLGRDVFGVDSFLMMDEQQMSRYTFFRWIGAFSVNRSSGRDMIGSIEYATQLFDRPNRLLWMYPQGDLQPNDVRPLRFHSGVVSIAERLHEVQLIPLAHRYEFLMEQRPEAFVSIGEPLVITEVGRRKALLGRLEAALTQLLDDLRCRITTGKGRESSVCLLRGRRSTNVRYDRFRLKNTAA
jgi:chlorobactene lauroyltransferase